MYLKFKSLFNRSMKANQAHIKALTTAVAVIFGHIPHSPADFDLLALSISKKTARSVSPSTLKRLWGYITDQTGTSYTTLSILSQYAGYPDWDSFCRFYPNQPADSDFTSGQILISNTISIGTTVGLEWDNNKSCTLVKISATNQFKTLSAENIKPRPGDILTVEEFALNRPLTASSCIRKNINLGTYTGARSCGLMSISLDDKACHGGNHKVFSS